MNYQSMVMKKRTVKYAMVLAIFSGILLLGLFGGRLKASGEIAVSGLESEAAFTGYDSTLDTALCIDEELYGNCDEVEVPYDLENEKSVIPATQTRPEVIWEKNAINLGNFTPDMIYVLEDAGSYFGIVETQAIADDDGKINLVAFGMDENDNDYYSFHMSYEEGGQDWKPAFVQFVTTFKN